LGRVTVKNKDFRLNAVNLNTSDIRDIMGHFAEVAGNRRLRFLSDQERKLGERMLIGGSRLLLK
jgi:hypothetical protein